jgi:DNA-binding MarR family transcriptional regulator
MSFVTPTSLKELASFRYELRRFLGFSEGTAEAEGISAQQYQLLQVIAAAGDTESASITYIAERMVLRHNSTVELVDRAVKAGMVERTGDPADQRRSLIRLTPLGTTTFEVLATQHIKELARRGPALISALQKVIAMASDGATPVESETPAQAPSDGAAQTNNKAGQNE